MGKTDMSRVKTFSYRNRVFQVKASSETDGWAIRLFEAGSRISPLVYKITYEGEIDAKMHDHPGDFVEHLMALMQSDVESGRLQVLPKSN
jgi:hypothetical protein